MIVIGYPGVGKSTLARKCSRCVDLESSAFFVEGIRPDDWYVYYCSVAEDLSRQGKTVFVSSHKLVMDQLLESKENIIMIIPHFDLKDEWIEKLYDRYMMSFSEKDKKAFERARDHIDEDIVNMYQYPYRMVFIQDMNYDLLLLIDNAKMGIGVI